MVGDGVGVLVDTMAAAACAVIDAIDCAVEVASKSRLWRLFCIIAKAPTNPTSNKRTTTPAMTNFSGPSNLPHGSRAAVLPGEDSSISSVGMYGGNSASRSTVGNSSTSASGMTGSLTRVCSTESPTAS